MYLREKKKFPAHPISIFPSFPPPPPGNPYGKMQEEEVGHKVCPSILQGGGKEKEGREGTPFANCQEEEREIGQWENFYLKICYLNEHFFFVGIALF